MGKVFSFCALFAASLLVFASSVPVAQAGLDRPIRRSGAGPEGMSPDFEDLGYGGSRFGGGSMVPPAPEEVPSPPPAANPPFPTIFGLGLDYGRVKDWMGISDPGQLFSSLGAKWVKFPAVPWSLIQPDKNGEYDWWLLDSMVQDYQSNGFSILAVLLSDAPWAVTGGGGVSSPPKDEFWTQYEMWVRAVVERYDGDGVDDMPGLKQPILDYQIESEPQHPQFWMVKGGKDPAQEYGRLLRVAYQAAHSANPNVRVVLAGINFGDLFDDGMSRGDTLLDAFVSIRFADRPDMRKLYQDSLAFIRKVLGYYQYFDAIEFHYNHDYRAAGATVKWLKEQMAAHGYSKPIWAGDALIANSLYIDSRNHSIQLPLGTSVFDALDNREGPLHGAAWNWYMADQASNLCKKLITAMDLGLVGIMASNEADWPDWRSHGVFWVYAGFYGQGGQDLMSAVRGKRPVFYTYKMLSDFLKGGEAKVARISVEDKPDLYLFRVGISGEDEFYIAWYENPELESKLKVLTDPVAFLYLELTAKPATVDLSSVLGNRNGGRVKIKKLVTHMKEADVPMIPDDETGDVRSLGLGRSPVLLFTE